MNEPLILSIDNLRTTFYTDQETIRAVDGISFEVASRESLGIVGESGSGKSVTARSILGLVSAPGSVHPDSAIRYHRPGFVQQIANEYPNHVRWQDGSSDSRPAGDDTFVTITGGEGTEPTVTVDSGWVDLAAAPKSVVRSVRGSEIAMVFQDAQSSLNPVFTVGNQLKELLRTHRGLRGREATQTAADILESVGIPDPKRRLTEYPHQFSGGMQQRAAIALAIACDPAVLICDEPTTALDVTIQAQILELLEGLQKERDLSIVFITHDMGVVAQIADSVSVMYAGEIVEQAPVSRLFNVPKHPYSQGLLESIPGLVTEGDRLPTIDGQVPTPSEQATKCRYAPRCPKAFDECEEVHPSLVPVADSRGESPDDGTSRHYSSHRAACLLHPDDEPLANRLIRHREQDRLEATEDDPAASGGSTHE